MARSKPKKSGPEKLVHSKIKGDPKAASERAKRPTPERPPAPRAPPKRPGR